MFGENRDEEGWSPFSVQKKTVDKYQQPKLGEAVEIHPIVVMSNQKRAVVQAVPLKEDEAEATAETDPKAQVSSATNSAEDSGKDSSTSSLPPIQTQELTHPSSLAPEEETPVSVEKVPSPPAQIASTLMNLGCVIPLAKVSPSE